MTTTLSNEQRALLEKVDKWSMSDPLVMAVGAALATIDAQREEIERLKETDAESLRVWEREQKRIAVLEAEVRSLREGDREAAQVEEQIGMFIKDVPARLAALEAENAPLRDALGAIVSYYDDEGAAENCACPTCTARRPAFLAALDVLRKEGK